MLIRIFKWIAIGTALVLMTALPTLLAQENSNTDSTNEAVLKDLRLRVQELEAKLAAIEMATAQSATAAHDPADNDLIAGRGDATFLPRRTPAESSAPPDEAATSMPKAGDILSDGTLEVSGFFDGVYQADLNDSRRNDAALNQIELDLLRPLGKRAEAALSLCYDEEFYVGAATMSYAMYLAEETEKDGGPLISEWVATAGQFDVPFGLDYEMYCSIDRPTITSPAVVEATHDSWNDLGFLTSLNARLGRLDAFVVKGYESEVWNSDEELPVDVSSDDERWLIVSPEVSAGARLSMSVLSGIECGASLARGWASHGAAAMSLVGVHARVRHQGFSVKAEGISSRKAESVAPRSTEGYYVEMQQSFGRVYGIARADQVDDDLYGNGRYYGAGAGVTVVEGLLARGEFQWNASEETGQVFLQVAARF